MDNASKNQKLAPPDEDQVVPPKRATHVACGSLSEFQLREHVPTDLSGTTDQGVLNKCNVGSYCSESAENQASGGLNSDAISELSSSLTGPPGFSASFYSGYQHPTPQGSAFNEAVSVHVSSKPIEEGSICKAAAEKGTVKAAGIDNVQIDLQRIKNYFQGSRLAHFHGLPKTHKRRLGIRPNLSASGPAKSSTSVTQAKVVSPKPPKYFKFQLCEHVPTDLSGTTDHVVAKNAGEMMGESEVHQEQFSYCSEDLERSLENQGSLSGLNSVDISKLSSSTGPPGFSARFYSGYQHPTPQGSAFNEAVSVHVSSKPIEEGSICKAAAEKGTVKAAGIDNVQIDLQRIKNYFQGSRLAHFHGLPKTHKRRLGIRPNLSASGPAKSSTSVTQATQAKVVSPKPPKYFKRRHKQQKYSEGREYYNYDYFTDGGGGRGGGGGHCNAAAAADDDDDLEIGDDIGPVVQYHRYPDDEDDYNNNTDKLV